MNSTDTSVSNISYISDRKIKATYDPATVRSDLGKIKERIRALKQEKDVSNVNLKAAKTKHREANSKWCVLLLLYMPSQNENEKSSCSFSLLLSRRLRE